MVFEENQFVHGSSLESVLYTDVGCTDETIGREFDVFDQPKWPLSSRKIFVGNEDDIFDAEIVLDVAPLLSELQFRDVLAHEPAEKVVGDCLHHLPAASDVVGLGVGHRWVASEQQQMTRCERRGVIGVGTHLRQRPIVDDLLGFAHEGQKLFVGEKAVMDEVAEHRLHRADKSFPHSPRVGRVGRVE